METKEQKQYYVIVNGQKVEVTEEVYRAYVRPVRAQQRTEKRNKRCKVKGERFGLVRCNGDCSKCEYAKSGKVPDFLERATNVYRTKFFIVRQQIMYRRDSLLGAYLCSRDTFYCRTPERDRQFEAAFPRREEKDGKRIPTLMYIRTYID